MDFDDLEDAEADAGPTPAQRAEELASKAMPEVKPFPAPSGKCFGTNGAMKMLYLMGGGVNEKIANMQVTSMFKDIPDGKKNLEWTIWPGVHKVATGWNHDHSLAPFGPDFWVYYERWPWNNCAWETWEGIEKSITGLKKLLKEKGPFDGVLGFDMGGELALHMSGLAQEGDPDLQGRLWRFMMIFTAGPPRHLSPLGPARIKSPLCLPTIIGWADTDFAHPFTIYEEGALFIHPDYREVFRHDDGHKPPKLTKGMPEFDRLAAFLEDRRDGVSMTPSDHADTLRYKGLWLPLARTVPSKWPATARKRLLLVQDPMGAHDLDERKKELEEKKKRGELPPTDGELFVSSNSAPRMVESAELCAAVRRLTAADFKAKSEGLEIEELQYSDAHRAINWHGAPPAPVFWPEDAISGDQHDLKARAVADELMASFQVEESDALGIVGVGTGAFIALAVAKIIVREKRRVPAAFFVVEPPSLLPSSSVTSPGNLVDCPVYSFLHKDSAKGTFWRYEISTCGPYQHTTYDGTEDLIGKICDAFRTL